MADSIEALTEAAPREWLDRLAYGFSVTSPEGRRVDPLTILPADVAATAQHYTDAAHD